MARQVGIIKLQGTIGGITFVHSQKHKKHSRTARGTYKKVTINPDLKANSKKADKVTGFGKHLLRKFKECADDFTSSTIWYKMLGRLFKAKGTSTADFLESLKGLELNEKYPLSRMISNLPELKVSIGEQHLAIETTFEEKPSLPDEATPEAFFCEINMLLYDGRQWKMQTRQTNWISMEESKWNLQMKFEKSKGARYYIVVIGIRKGKNCKTIESLAATGYAVWNWGNC